FHLFARACFKVIGHVIVRVISIVGRGRNIDGPGVCPSRLSGSSVNCNYDFLTLFERTNDALDYAPALVHAEVAVYRVDFKEWHKVERSQSYSGRPVGAVVAGSDVNYGPALLQGLDFDSCIKVTDKRQRFAATALD